MPTYEYECRRCGHKFELFQSIKSQPKAECPKCSGSAKRLIGTGGGIIFKGPGFYATDYRKSSSKDREEKKGTPGSCPKDCSGCDKPRE